MATIASAHTGGGAFIQLLPTHLYVGAGAAVVLVSFVVAAWLPPAVIARSEVVRVRLARVPVGAPAALSTAASLVSLAITITLVAAGYLGSRDPLANPLPSFVWTVFWVGLTYVHAVAGNVWAHVNPWSGAYRIARNLGIVPYPPFTYPPALVRWPAALGLLLFAWFELIDPAPFDPARLATAVVVYLAVHVLGIVLTGEAWLTHAETFSVFFRLVSWLSPFEARRERAGDAVDVTVGPPAQKLLTVEPLDASGGAFVLLALSAVSFDGLSRTFWWLAFVGENPLEYPGRSVLVVRNTIGLLSLFVILSLAYVAVVAAGARLAGVAASATRWRGRLVLSLVPIAFGYHFAHYLPVFLVDVQHAVRAAADPFARGWNLLGTRDLHVVTSFLSDPSRVYTIWHVQIAMIVAAHVAAVWVAHVVATRGASRAAGIRSQLPLVFLMIAYTMFGLWLSSTPTAG